LESVSQETALAIEALTEEIAGLRRAMDRQVDLLLELVKLQQENLIEVSEGKSGEIPEDGPGEGMYCEILASN